MLAERPKTITRELRPVSPRSPVPPASFRVEDRLEAPRPMAQRGSKVVRRARALGWRSPETVAVLVASFFVSLAALYVSAYAHIAADGMEEARLTRQLHDAAQLKETLHARISQLSLAPDVQAHALEMNMERNQSDNTQLLLRADSAPVTGAVSPPASLVTAQLVPSAYRGTSETHRAITP